MMNEQQIAIGEEILRRLIERDCEIHSSDLFDVFGEMEYQKRSMVARLLADHGLVQIQEPVYEGYNIRVTAEGIRAYKMGLRSYFEYEESNKALDVKRKRFTITSGKAALIVAGISIIIDIARAIDWDNVLSVKNAAEVNENRNDGENNYNDGKPFDKFIITPETIDAIRDSLLHDTVFLDAVRKQNK
jgi:hypothetical protein